MFRSCCFRLNSVYRLNITFYFISQFFFSCTSLKNIGFYGQCIERARVRIFARDTHGPNHVKPIGDDRADVVTKGGCLCVRGTDRIIVSVVIYEPFGDDSYFLSGSLIRRLFFSCLAFNTL